MTAYVDLHCHTRASFDSLASPEAVVRAATERGLTHLAITDHDRIDGALRARDVAPDGLTIIVGEEVKTADGDLIAVFLERAVAPGRPARETIAEVRAQGGLVGIPHPFDRYRGSMLKDPGLEAIGELVDWVEAHNARIVGGTGNERAAAVRARAGAAGDLRLRRAQHARGGRGLHRCSMGTRPRRTGSWPRLRGWVRGARARPGDLLRPCRHAVREGGQAGPRERPAPARRRGRAAPPMSEPPRAGPRGAGPSTRGAGHR